MKCTFRLRTVPLNTDDVIISHMNSMGRFLESAKLRYDTLIANLTGMESHTNGDETHVFTVESMIFADEPIEKLRTKTANYIMFSKGTKSKAGYTEVLFSSSPDPKPLTDYGRPPNIRHPQLDKARRTRRQG